MFCVGTFELILKASSGNWSFRSVSNEIRGVYFSTERTMVIRHPKLKGVVFKSCDTCCLILFYDFHFLVVAHSVFLVRAFFWNLYEWPSFRTYAEDFSRWWRINRAQWIFAFSLWTWAVFIIFWSFDGFLFFIWFRFYAFWPFVCAVR